MSIFEAGMLISFGFAWPIKLINTYRARTAKGVNPLFSIVIIMGYCCGIIHKLLYSRDMVLAIYIINLSMVIADFCLYFRNRRLDREQETY